MCYDLSEFDPFEPILLDYSEYEDWTYYSYPMTEDDWENYLTNGNTNGYQS